MEPPPPAAVPEPRLPLGPQRDGTGLEPELEPEPESGLWLLEAAEPIPGPPPWSPPEHGDCLGLEGSAETPARAEEEEPRLRPVFDALDRDGDGFVRVEEFVQFATAYGAEQVRAAGTGRACTGPGPTLGWQGPGRLGPPLTPALWRGPGSPQGKSRGCWG